MTRPALALASALLAFGIVGCGDDSTVPCAAAIEAAEAAIEEMPTDVTAASQEWLAAINSNRDCFDDATLEIADALAMVYGAPSNSE